MSKKLITTSIFICFILQFSFSQIPGLTFSQENEHPHLYLKSKTVWITATPFFHVGRKFSPDQGATYIKLGMFGGNLKPYVQNDSIARHSLNSYKLIRYFGIAQMGVIAPLLAYKHFYDSGTTTSTGDATIDNNVILEEETGYLTVAIIVFCTGTLTYHVFSKGFLFDALARYNYILSNKTDFEDVSFNLNVKIDQISQTPQLSLVWTF
ncbi:MAG: hypothetical protein PF485_09030 [Bacteroidales bacterium]|jgi:hypothetical protein|nr:hypothetical protein [Bacteroidales bacterium]